MYTDVLPSHLHAKFGGLQFLKKRGQYEYSAACPVCGDSGHVGNDWPDRFRIFDDDKPLGWCRQCGHMEFADDEYNSRPSPAQIVEAQERRAKLADQERQRLASKIQELQKSAVWQFYHEQMTEQHRAIWNRAGIPDQFQDWWELGFTPDYRGRDFISPALTIPYFRPGRETGKTVYNIQYRLMKPPSPNDKYRFSYGLKPGLWLADPDSKPSGACLVMEGMKKAAVTFIEVVARAGNQFSVVAVPNKTPGNDLLAELGDCDPLYIALDPDAYQPIRTKTGHIQRPAVNRLVKALGKRARIVKLPVKADDLFTVYRGSAADFMRFVQGARGAV